MEDQFQPAKTELNNLSIKEIFFKYVKFLPFVILSVVLALLGAFIYLRYATPVYQSAGSIVINVDNNTSSGDNDKFQKLFVGGSKDISNEIEVLRSRPLMEKVVEDLHLNFAYYAKGKIKERNIYSEAPFQVNVFQLNDSNSSFTFKIDFTNPTTFTINDENKPLTFEQVFKNQWGTFSLSRKPSKPLSDEYRVVWQPSRAVAGDLVSNLLVAPKGPAGILIISLEATHPQLAADVINELMKE
jgi:tyrosine-protein kinase Etk/Wzc